MTSLLAYFNVPSRDSNWHIEQKNNSGKRFRSPEEIRTRYLHRCAGIYLFIYLFMVNLTTLLVAETIDRQIIWLVVNNELERIWKETVF
jgi:hypothetical protein